MANYSRVTNKQYFQVHNPNGKNFKDGVTGWYVGGALKTSQFGQKCVTLHFLQATGEVVGVNMTPGYTKQFLQGNDITGLLDPAVC